MEFANDLIRTHGVEVDPAAGTQIKVRAVFDAQESMSPSVRAYVDRLIAFWRAVSDLAQRQEHAASRDNSPLTVEDARRLVFQTLVVMAEIEQHPTERGPLLTVHAGWAVWLACPECDSNLGCLPVPPANEARAAKPSRDLPEAA